MNPYKNRFLLIKSQAGARVTGVGISAFAASIVFLSRSPGSNELSLSLGDMVTELIDEGRQRLLTLAKRLQAVDGLLEDELTGDAATQQLQCLGELLLGGFRVLIEALHLVGVFARAVVGELQVDPLVQEIAEELLLLVRVLQLVELVNGDGDRILCLNLG